MNIFEELTKAMLGIEDPAEELECRGFSDHDGLRAFTLSYGKSIAEMVRETNVATHAELAHDLGAAMVGGFLLGLDYAQRHPEMSDLPPVVVD
jgi:hypothetical protein